MDENVSSEVDRLVRLKLARDAEADAFERVHGVPLTAERRARARAWVREQLAAAAERTEATREAREEIRRQMGWAA